MLLSGVIKPNVEFAATSLPITLFGPRPIHQGREILITRIRLCQLFQLLSNAQAGVLSHKHFGTGERALVARSGREDESMPQHRLILSLPTSVNLLMGQATNKAPSSNR